MSKQEVAMLCLENLIERIEKEIDTMNLTHAAMEARIKEVNTMIAYAYNMDRDD